jgi:hypothetical protein
MSPAGQSGRGGNSGMKSLPVSPKERGDPVEFLMSKEAIEAYQRKIWNEMDRGDFIPSHFDDCGLRNVGKYGEKLGCPDMEDVCVFVKHDNYEIDTGWNDVEVYQEFVVFRKKDYRNLVDEAGDQPDKTAAAEIDAIGVFYLDNTFCLKDQSEEGKITLEVSVVDEKPEIRILRMTLHWH